MVHPMMKWTPALVLLTGCLRPTYREPPPDPYDYSQYRPPAAASAAPDAAPPPEPVPVPTPRTASTVDPDSPFNRVVRRGPPPEDNATYCIRTYERRLAEARARVKEEADRAKLAEYRKAHCKHEERAIRAPSDDLCEDENGVLRRCIGIFGVQHIYHCPADGPPGARGTVIGEHSLPAMRDRVARGGDESRCGRISLDDAGAP